jgi:hypothetical protein
MTSPKDSFRQKHQAKKEEKVEYKDPNAHIVAMQNGEVDHRGDKIDAATETAEVKSEPTPEVVAPTEAPVAEEPKHDIEEEQPKEEPVEFVDPNAHLATVHETVVPSETEPEAAAPTDEKKN